MYYTERLCLKTAEEIRVEDLLSYVQFNKGHLQAFEPIRDKKYYSYEAQSNLLDFDLRALEEGSGLKLFITLRNHNQIIGLLHFSNIVMGPFKSCYVGYSLDYRFLKKGYMTEALAKGLDIIFNQYGLHRVEGNVMPSNKSSIALLEKLDFKEEGLAKKYLQINGIWEDHIHFTKLNEV